ncbi:nascent polypeptide-associated complex subunit alpha, muscle-specific form-like [Thrips palmi]|uniref:Nascent polypeptide-associated complex subunit alpha, muscle-specific form-like n=1 Tax=Thrips palmi TaxID=161013 RepID=A0A6P9A5R6_THRPL|nr:nascent polypeptide-associated complex subunit alpha, muscle-specific form-like [Thrips palmi]
MRTPPISGPLRRLVEECVILFYGPSFVQGAPVERLDAALPPQPKKVELGTPSKPVSRVFSAQARLERLSASLSSRPEKAEEGSPASVKPDSRPPALEHLDLVPPLEVEPASVSPPEGNAGKTATSVAATAGSLPSAWNGAPSPPKSSLRPTAPAWVPPSMRPSGQARGLMPPRPRSPSASMRPVALPTPPQSPPSKSAWSDFLVGQSYIQPPMQYKCPAQGRFDRLKMPKLNEVKAEVQVKPGDAAPNCDDFHWEGKLFDALCTGNPVPVSNGNHVPVKLEVPSSDRDQKVSDLDGFTTPPYMEGSYDARKNILPSVKEECHSDTERKGVSARLKLSNKFAEENSDQNKAAPIGAPVSRPVVLICDDKSMSTIPNDLFTCQSNRSDSQVSGPVNSLGQSANAVTGHSRQEPAGKSRGQSQVNHTTYTNCGWSNQQKPSAQSAAELAASHSFVVASPCVVVTPLQSGVGLTPLRSFAAPTSGLAPLSVLGPAPPAPPCSSYGMPSPAPNFAPYFSAPRPASNFAPHFSAPRPPSNFAPHFSAPRPASNFAPHFSAPRPASNFAPHFSAPRPASNFAPDFSAAPRPAPNFGALPSGPNFAAPPSAPNFAVPQPPASKAVSQPPAASKAVPQPPAASKAVPQPAPASKAVPQPPAASKAAPPPATDAEASRPSVCADALAEVRGLIEEADACPRPQSPAWETVRARRPHLSRAASPSGPARSRTSSPAGRFSVLSTESPTSSGCSSRATSPARTDRKTDVPLWRRGGGDADASIKTSGEWVHWKTATTTTANPSTPSCPSTESVPPAQAQRDAPVSLRPEAASAKPAAPPLPVCNCVCSSDCIIATYKYYRDLRPGPHVERRCLKKGLLNGAPRPRLSSRLVIN